MRVAHVTLDGNLPRYGIGLAVVSLARALARRGHEVTLACREAAAPLVARAEGVTVVGLRKTRGLLGGSFAYRRQIRRATAGGVDVVHVHGLARAAWWLRSPRARRGAPLVVTAHAADELGPSASAAGEAPERRALRHALQIRAVVARADAVIAPSRWMAARVTALGGRPVDVIGLGPTDEAPLDPEPHDGFVVAALARLVPVKGVDTLLDAFAAAFATVGEARLVIGGEGPLRDGLEQRAASLGVRERVDFVGYVEGEARRRLLARADVVAVPTRGDYETFGLAALDGSAAGLPIVVSDGGALPERVENGEGICVPSGDVPALARALTQIRSSMSDRNERQTICRIGHATASRCSWDAVAAAHEALYGRIHARSN